MSYSAGAQDGKYLKKRNTFTDVVATAEHLIAEKYTSKSMLCIQVRQPFPVLLSRDRLYRAQCRGMFLRIAMCMVSSIDL